jgi:hypothetical protein
VKAMMDDGVMAFVSFSSLPPRGVINEMRKIESNMSEYFTDPSDFLIILNQINPFYLSKPFKKKE